MLRSIANWLKPQALNRQGYTIDQTILIVAIIAILITLIIITIGWQLINRTSGTKLGSQLKQVEDAVAQFYAKHRVFPHQAFTSPAQGVASYANVGVLGGALPTGFSLISTIPSAQLEDYLPGLRRHPNGSNALLNGYGDGSATDSSWIGLQAGSVTAWTTTPANQQYIIITSRGVNLADAQEADRSIDRFSTPTTGRLVYSAPGVECLPATQGGAAPTLTSTTIATVNVCYVATPIQ